MAHKCTECGDRIDTDNGRYGHFRFTDGGGHRPMGEVPDDYKAKFEEIESGGDVSSEPEPGGNGEGNGSAGDSGGDSESGGDVSSEPEPEGNGEGNGSAGDSGGDSGGDSESGSGSRSLSDRIVTALNTDLRELFGGG